MNNEGITLRFSVLYTKRLLQPLSFSDRGSGYKGGFRNVAMCWPKLCDKICNDNILPF